MYIKKNKEVYATWHDYDDQFRQIIYCTLPCGAVGGGSPWRHFTKVRQRRGIGCIYWSSLNSSVTWRNTRHSNGTDGYDRSLSVWCPNCEGRKAAERASGGEAAIWCKHSDQRLLTLTRRGDDIPRENKTNPEFLVRKLSAVVATVPDLKAARPLDQGGSGMFGWHPLTATLPLHLTCRTRPHARLFAFTLHSQLKTHQSISPLRLLQALQVYHYHVQPLLGHWGQRLFSASPPLSVLVSSSVPLSSRSPLILGLPFRNFGCSTIFSPIHTAYPRLFVFIHFFEGFFSFSDTMPSSVTPFYSRNFFLFFSCGV